MTYKMTKKAIAEIAGVRPATITLYTQMGLIVPGIFDAKGRGTNKLYSKKNIDEIIVIKSMKEMNFTLSEIKGILLKWDKKLDKLFKKLIQMRNIRNDIK